MSLILSSDSLQFLWLQLSIQVSVIYNKNIFKRESDEEIYIFGKILFETTCEVHLKNHGCSQIMFLVQRESDDEIVSVKYCDCL